MRPLVRGARAIWRVLWRSKQLDADMQEEMRFHVEMEADRPVRAHGLDPRRRGASLRPLRRRRTIQGRRTRSAGLYWLDGVSLDARLGVRMLVKHRWLTLVGGVAMTVAIAIGATAFEVISDLLDPALPFPHGDRVVAVSTWRRKPAAPITTRFTRSARGAITSPRSNRRARSARRSTTSWRPTRRRNRSGRRDHRVGVRHRADAAARRPLPAAF